jgi:signal peptidase I
MANINSIKGMAALLCRVSFVAAGLLLLATLAAPIKTFAEGLPTSTQCGSDTLNYTALYKTTPDTYDVYARMGLPGETAQASLSYAPFSGTACQTIGAASISGAQWTKLGQLSSSDPAGLGTLTLSSADFQDVPGASSPTVLLVSAAHPVCQPTTECAVALAGKRAVVHAAGDTTGGDTLHVVTATDIANDKLQRVDYYVDNKFAYTLPTVEPFDLHYVGSDQHTLATVATYASGQQLVISSSVDRGYTDQISYLFFTFVHQQKSILLAAAILFLCAVLFQGFVSLTRAWHRRKLWRQHHGLSPASAEPTFVQEKKVDSLKKAALLVAGTITAVVIISIINSWVISAYQVDGHSMESTYYTGNWLLINKLGKSLSAFNHKDYVPKRGQVVVFAKAQNVTFQPESAGQQTYLVKRVIALPGERVTVKSGTITVYNAAHPSGFDPDTDAPWHSTLHLSNSDNIDLTLQPDEIFVCGDNRPESVDSRTFGPVKVDEIVGNVGVKF